MGWATRYLHALPARHHRNEQQFPQFRLLLRSLHATQPKKTTEPNLTEARHCVIRTNPHWVLKNPTLLFLPSNERRFSTQPPHELPNAPFFARTAGRAKQDSE